MQFNITPIKAKITDEKTSNIMNVQISQDNGTACMVAYNVGYTGDPVNGQPAAFQAMLPNAVFKITGEEYAAYSAANTSLNNRFNFAAAYVASKVPAIVIVAE